MMTRTLAVLLVTAAVLGAGCRTLAPEYVQPDAPVPDTFAQATPGADGNAADIPWRTFFADDRLRTVVEQAVANNRDLRRAALNIERARALYRIQRSALFPTVNATASGVRQRIPEGLFAGATGAFNAEQYAASVGVSGYELDVFGRLRSLNDRAVQTYLATEQVRRAVQIGLVAEVAQAYLTYGADLDRLALARDTLKAQDTSLGLTRQRLDAGVASGLDVRQAETTVERARADVAQFTARVEQDRLALDLIAGTALDPTLLPDRGGATLTALSDLAAGVPSEVLLQRPDILAAEHQLRATYANIGAARANFFPTISLTGSTGVASRALGSLFTAGAGAWSFAPQVLMPLFNAGRNKATLEVANVDRALAVAAYEQAIQLAFRDVADALAVRATIDDQLAARQAVVTSADAGLRLADARFKGGVDNYLPVLDAQRVLYQAQQDLIAVTLARQANSVSLYRALGGGWTPPAAAADPASTTQP